MEITQQDVELNKLLSNLGYNLDNQGKEVFIDVILDALDYIGRGKTLDEVYDMIMAKKTSPIYVELAYFTYEKGLPFIHKSIENFHYGKQRSLYNDKVMEEEPLDAYNSVFNIVKYINDSTEYSKKQSSKKMSIIKK